MIAYFTRYPSHHILEFLLLKKISPLSSPLIKREKISFLFFYIPSSISHSSIHLFYTDEERQRKHGWTSLWMPRGQNANCTDLVTLTIQHWRRLSLPPLENAVPRARNRLSLIIASLLRTVASHRFHPRYWQCKLLITLSRPRIAIVASGSRALHACMQRDGHGAYITIREDPLRPNKGAKSPRPA